MLANSMTISALDAGGSPVDLIASWTVVGSSITNALPNADNTIDINTSNPFAPVFSNALDSPDLGGAGTETEHFFFTLPNSVKTLQFSSLNQHPVATDGVNIGIASVVPEPSAALLGLAGAVFFLLRRRR